MKIIILISVFYSSLTLAQTVAIIDMPIKREFLSKELSQKVISIHNLIENQNLSQDCHQLADTFEKFFKFTLENKLDEVQKLKNLDKLEDFAYQIHGYHILNLVSDGVNPKVHFIGVPPPITKDKLKNIDHYINIELQAELAFIKKHLEKIKPDFVNISGSESIDDNIFFFKQNKVPNKVATQYAKRIFNSWESFWKKIIAANPKTKFIVSAGNGGRDGLGDKLNENTRKDLLPTPANINLPNVIVVGSKKDKKLSPFSNYGSMVDVFENGEQINSYIPCKKDNSLKLTGTSQSTAIHLNKLIKEFKSN